VNLRPIFEGDQIMLPKKLTLSTIIMLAILALLVGCRGGEETAVLNEVTFIAGNNSFNGPDTIPAGWTQIRLQNEGPEFYHVQLMRLEEGKTVADLTAALVENPVAPAWAKHYGGPNPPHVGESSTAVIYLEAGDYALIDTVPGKDGTPHVHHGMAKAVRVTPNGDNAAAEPTADVVMDMDDFSFSLSRPLSAGVQTIRVNNRGAQPHEVFLARLAPGKSAGDLLASLAPDAPPEAIDWQALGGVSVIESGAHSYFTAELEPGTYALLCFAPDHDSGAPHFMMGMMQEFVVE
jgi:hypothetical protein